jgi:hypothetical protein
MLSFTRFHKVVLFLAFFLLIIASCTKSEALAETLSAVRAMPFGIFAYEDGYIYFNPLDKPDDVYKVNISDEEPAYPVKMAVIPSKANEQLSFDIDVLFADKAYINFYCCYGDWVFYSNYSDGSRLYRKELDGSSDEKVLDASTCDFFIRDGQLYYIDQTGPELYFENNITLYRNSNDKIPAGFENFGRIRSFDITAILAENTYDKADESMETFYARADGVCAKKCTQIEWAGY